MGRGGDGGIWFLTFLVMSVIIFIVSCFLLGFSFDTVPPTKIAFLYNNNTHKIEVEEGLYNADYKGSGRYFTGIGQEFLEFPGTIQDLVFDCKFPVFAAEVHCKA